MNTLIKNIVISLLLGLLYPFFVFALVYSNLFGLTLAEMLVWSHEFDISHYTLSGFMLLACSGSILSLTTLFIAQKLLSFNFQSVSSGAITEKDIDDGRERGVVKWFNIKKGFGFITWDSGEDVFVHFRSIRGEGHRWLKEGQTVKFHTAHGDKGIQAEDVSVVFK